jgi:hypothetical protein
MIKILPRHREEIETLVDELGSTEFAKADDSQVAPIVKKLRDFFQSYGTGQLRSQYDRTKTALGRSDICLNLSSPHNNSAPQGIKREYFGKYRKTIIRLSGFSNYVSLQRVYNKEFKMNWRLNCEGRLDFVDAVIFPNEVCHLVRTEGYPEKPCDWDFGIMEFFSIPDKVNSINPGFSWLEPDKRHQPLMRFGHSMAREFLESLARSKVTNFDCPRHGEKALSDVRYDDDFMNILTKAGDILPYIVGRDGRLAMVEYRGNDRYL